LHSLRAADDEGGPITRAVVDRGPRGAAVADAEGRGTAADAGIRLP